MDDDESARGLNLSSPYVLVLALFIAAILDVTMFNGGFLVSGAYREMRPAISGGVLVVALLLWFGVLGAARRNAVAVSEIPVQTVRGRNGVFQPVSAIVLLLFAASIASGHSIPKHLHGLTTEVTDRVTFTLVDAPSPERRGCRETRASNPSYGNVILCLPVGVALAFEEDAGARAVVSASGTWSDFGFQPEHFELIGSTAIDASNPADELSGFPDFFDDLLEDKRGDRPAPRSIGKPKDLNR